MFAEGSTQSPEFFKREVLKIIADARSCYIEGSTDRYSDGEFAEMMLLDDCFLIYYMGIGNQNKQHQFLMYKHLGSLVLSLGGNKNEGKTDKNKGEEAVSNFLHESIWGQYTEQQVQDSQQHQHQPLHLFEAFRRVLFWDNIPQSQVNKDQKQNVDLKKHHKTFRTAKDLKAKGIHFKPSCNKSLKDINFYSFTFYGQLQLPTWFVSSLSKVFFMNMIAYELCPNNLVDSTVISYLNFMKSIVESPEDVKELREKRILLTQLGSDEEVVRLYRDLNTYGVANTRSYQDVKERIQEHYDSKAKTWMAELIHNYFSSPWSIIAWLAGVLLLVLTFLQTYFTINQV
ncbi:hypothetical protein Pfo_016242 [Paulownia fortunei]|nr:hypothetical protein Pfo_016242 [Paulownia fortunei]